MTPRDLFNIVLKIFGLFFLREIVYIIPQLVSSIPFMTKSDNFGEVQNTNDGLLSFIVTLVIIAFYVFIIYQLLFKTNNIVDKLKLDRGFNQEEFSLNISSSWALTIALIVLGGVILVNEIPILCETLYQYIQQKRIQRYTGTQANLSYAIRTGAKIIVGLLIIGERKRIVGFTERREKKNTEE